MKRKRSVLTFTIYLFGTTYFYTVVQSKPSPLWGNQGFSLPLSPDKSAGVGNLTFSKPFPYTGPLPFGSFTRESPDSLHRQNLLTYKVGGGTAVEDRFVAT